MSLALTPEIILELKSKYGQNLRAVRAEKHTLVFRKPSRGEYDRWRDQLSVDRSQISRVDRELAKACVVWPGEQSFDEVLEDQPAVLGADIIPALTSLAGVSDSVTVEKL